MPKVLVVDDDWNSRRPYVGGAVLLTDTVHTVGVRLLEGGQAGRRYDFQVTLTQTGTPGKDRAAVALANDLWQSARLW